MTSTGQTADREHPIQVAVRVIEEQLSAISQTPAWSMDDTQTRDALRLLTRLSGRLAAAQAKVAAHAETMRVADATGAATTAAWLASAATITHAEAHRTMRLATALDTKHEAVAAALGAGRLVVDQAQVIIGALDALPADLGQDVADRACDHLLAQAADHDAKALRIMGKRILEVAAPEAADQILARQLEHEEAEAQAAASFRMVDDGHGKTHGRFVVATWQADLLRTALHAFASPHRPTDTLTGKRPLGSTPHGLGLAFGELIARYPADRLPTAGGLNATLVVTMDHQSLLGALKATQLATGTLISPALARRLACEAGIVPAVLGTDSVVLDQGRKLRLHNTQQRIAIGVRDKACTTEGCEVPAAWCAVHHDTPWAAGGSTDTTHARLLCPRHHGFAHDTGYDMTHHPEHQVAFTRRT